ncbi:MAG: hypothetical protein HC896_06485 [Bacteroidales bacterium]|nr:hypothetical protein [Bacteroidales bacterium]
MPWEIQGYFPDIWLYLVVLAQIKFKFIYRGMKALVFVYEFLNPTLTFIYNEIAE